MYRLYTSRIEGSPVLLFYGYNKKVVKGRERNGVGEVKRGGHTENVRKTFSLQVSGIA